MRKTVKPTEIVSSIIDIFSGGSRDEHFLNWFRTSYSRSISKHHRDRMNEVEYLGRHEEYFYLLITNNEGKKFLYEFCSSFCTILYEFTEIFCISILNRETTKIIVDCINGGYIVHLEFQNMNASGFRYKIYLESCKYTCIKKI